ncbi:BTAD domain-containing putative transcriptional regulator [Sphingosinicella soli]|uniref:DNA-binding SARP family transcriptional activator/TolB-like protein n=1 Tax=Sphingosinicella soli TaxID=333708 RepID=A0A7W7F765_9SPHN|nr:BTAD domain-containing putative transcriptional regulator [Sphingosinicella soli]MBB4632374.1 DNA-binding SARP family transcriptional activator/TolB-like protein [Sphingosinicella soli]
MRLQLLGEVRFCVGDADVTPRSKRARALVAYLALSRGYAAPRTRLADLFWGDRGEAQARGSLRQCLLEVRSAAAATGVDILSSDRESVWLSEGWQSDIAAIEAAIAGSPADIANAAEAAGREHLLGGLFVSDEYDEWLTLARADFDTRLADAARRGLARAVETGDTESARRIADHYLLRDPGDEEVTVLAMRADAMRGAAPIAHRRFQKLRDYLASELGTAPGPAALETLAGVAGVPVAVSAAAVIPAAPALPAHDGPPLLLVCPFVETGFAGDLLHLAEGVREEVLSGLSRFKDLRVLVEDRMPSSDEVPMFGAGTIAYALTATLRQSGAHVRVTPVLTRLSDRSVVWSNPVSIEVGDLQQAIDAMVDRIIGAVTPRVERDAVPRAQPSAVYDRYLFARHRARTASTLAEAKEAAALLEGVIADAPELAVAYPHLIRLYNTNYFYKVAGVDPAANRVRAFELAKTSLSLDRGHIHGYTVMGWCQLWRGGWDAARTHFENAVELNPYHSERIKEAAFGLIFLGEHGKGGDYLQRCLDLDPLPNDNFFEDLGFLKLMQRRPDEAVAYFDLIVEPTLFADLYGVLASCAVGHVAGPAMAAAWRRRIAAIWSPDVPMTDGNIVAWLHNHLPFRKPEHWSLFSSYLAPVLRNAHPEAA